MKVQIVDEAAQDLVDGYRFYEHQAAGVGDYFLNSFFSDIDSLRLYAGIHSLHFGYSRLLSKRFPFAVYYRTTAYENTILRERSAKCCRVTLR